MVFINSISLRNLNTGNQFLNFRSHNHILYFIQLGLLGILFENIFLIYQRPAIKFHSKDNYISKIRKIHDLFVRLFNVK